MIKACRRAIAAILCLAATPGCGYENGERGQSAGHELPGAAANLLTATPPSVAPEAASRGDLMLLVGGLEQVDDGAALAIPETALLVDLADGSEHIIPAPGGETPIRVDAAIGTPDGFVVVGSRCLNGRGLHPDDQVCRPGTPATFLFEADSRAWRELSMPALAPREDAPDWTIHPHLGLLAEGAPYLVAESGPRSPAPSPASVSVLRGDEWISIAELGRARVRSACGDASAVWTLEDANPPELPAEDPETNPTEPAELVLRSTMLDGTTTVTPLPPVDLSYRGIGVSLACDRSGVFLLSATQDTQTPVAIHRWSEAEWVRIGHLEPGLVSRVTSAEDGFVVINHAVAGHAAYELSASMVAVDAVTALGPELGDHLIVPDGLDGGFLAVGPLPALGNRLEAPSTPRDVVAAKRIEP